MTDKSKASVRPTAPTPFELAMMLLSFFAVIIVLTMTFAKLDEETYRLLVYVDTSICVIFLINFTYGLLKARQKAYYFKHHWIDLVASIPAIEPLRFARLFQILRVIRLIRMTRSLLLPLLKQRRQATLASLMLAMVTILSFASVLILLVESGAEGANIQTAENAIWWSIVTISTVGYGDFYPVTSAGHIIGSIVIVCGVSFFGVISGYMASVFVAPEENERLDSHNQEIKTELEIALGRMEENQIKMMAEISSLKTQLDQQQSKN
ncbi:ion transporter [Shewanella gelidii]|uniref:Ion transporter n=1 Tax=Shewanella gelidii TaxID=1642821 RepID=A0A917JKI0_9GAMM|nr:ion transporter [Shewanella gelidii]MCL1096889.1 ion transporter [Shewanella gelidii]GGI70911.1 ion transporter [Shewanella gelidii]